MNKNRILPLKEIPENIKDEVTFFVSDCSVALLGYSNKNIPVPNAIASGTLISIKSKYGILTAKHVWNEFKKNKYIDKIHFSIVGYHHFLAEKIEHLNVVLPSKEADICFLELPEILVGTFKSKRTFYPIRKENMPEINNVKNSLFVTIGFPLQLKEDSKKIVNPLRYFTHLVNYSFYKEKNYDEIELEINYFNNDKSKLPRSLVGMSGGGIWCFKISYNDDSGDLKYFIKRSKNSKVLLGVNYFQTNLKNNKRIIKGIGPYTIYNMLYDAVSEN